jgi:hypothetical protein
MEPRRSSEDFSTGSVITGPRVTEFTAFIAHKLAEMGSIHVSKDSGLFEAW